MMPAYRPDERYLRQALESVLQQAPGPEQMQIEVVDDCSPGAVCRVLASNLYDESDYYREYADFQKAIGNI